MDLRQIRYFLAVAQTLNFTSAARLCAVSQPALSKAVQKLEASLGAELFDRTSQTVALTDFGRTMRIHFERLEDSRRKAVDAAKAAATGPIEKLNVGVMCTIGPHRFGRFLGAFRISHPRIEVTLHDVIFSVIPEHLLSGSLDCVFCARPSDHDQRFQAIDLFDERMVVSFAPGHRFEGHESVPLAEVAKEPFLDRLHCEFRDDFMNFTRASGLDLTVSVRSEREDWILDLVRNGLGVSVMPSSSVPSGSVGHRLISDLPDLRRLELVMTANKAQTPALSAFRDAARGFDWE